MSDKDTTNQSSSQCTGQQERTLDDLFSLLQSLRSEVGQFRDDGRWLKTPLSETLEAANTVAEQADELRREVAELARESAEVSKAGIGMRSVTTEIAKSVIQVRNSSAEIAKVSRRIESKVNGIAIDVAEIKGTLYDHEVWLEALEFK
jgi:uncharacterized coiled-coil DUF342 family protein